MGYNPQLGKLLSRSKEHWGKEENRDNLLYYGINHFDQALFGLDIVRGEMIGIQAQEKNRKTTTLLNIISNVGHQLRDRGLWICSDTLESGMPPQAVADSLTAIKATRLLIADVFGLDRENWPKVQEIRKNEILKNNLTISKEFLWYGKFNQLQANAIQTASDSLATYPITIFGPTKDEGQSRDLNATLERWSKLYHGDYPGLKNKHHVIFATDNVQLYYGFGSDKFGQLEQTVGSMANFIVTHPGAVVLAVSQLGKTSMTNARFGGVEAYAKGGGALAAEVNVLIETDYDKEKRPEFITLRVPRTRKKPPPSVIQEVDPESGAFLRPAYPTIKNFDY